MILVKYSEQNHLKPYFYFALEEYILKYLLKDKETYFFTWKIKGVVIGKHQVIENEVNLNYLKNNKIDLYRRPTGGGAIYADENNTMFTIITKRSEDFSFKPYLNLIIEACKKINLNLEFSGRNDLLFKGKKISGVSFLQNKYGFLIHGTFMYDVDIETMVRTITPNNEKLISKGIDSVRSRVVNLKDHLNGLEEKELIKHITKEITTKEYILTREEEKFVERMAKKYEDKAWRFIKQPAYTKVLQKRISGGNFIVNLDLKQGMIKNITINGDYFDISPISVIEQALINQLYTEENIINIIKDLKVEQLILDIKEEEFIELLLSGIIN